MKRSWEKGEKTGKGHQKRERKTEKGMGKERDNHKRTSKEGEETGKGHRKNHMTLDIGHETEKGHRKRASEKHALALMNR